LASTGRGDGKDNADPGPPLGVIGKADLRVGISMPADAPARLGIVLPDPLGITEAALPGRLEALLEHARFAGISLIHVGDGPGAARTERALLKLLEPPGPWAIIVRREITGTPSEPPTVDGASERWLRISVELAPPASPDARLPPPLWRPNEVVPPVGRAPWGFAGRSAEGIEPLRERLRQLHPSWVRFPLHLLNAATVAPLVDRWSSDGVGVVVDDPFAGGLLDGGWLSGSPLEAAGPPRDLDWEATRQRLAPVAQLGYLTQGRGRTLWQAALSYARGRPGVAGVLARVRSAQDFQKLAPADRPVDAEDRDRVEGRPIPPSTRDVTPVSNTSGR
jgi:hypothetical protein